jgi:Prp8 binding protein
MQLSGHGGDIFCTKFSPCGDYVASAGADRTIMYWDVFGGCQNIGVSKGHKNAVLDLKWATDSLNIFSASADKTIICWDTTDFSKGRVFKGHEDNVNSIDLKDD